MKETLLCLLLVAAATAQRVAEPAGPVITTENGNLNVASSGNITFRAGQSGGIQFLTAAGEDMVVGQKGDKGDKGDQGTPGSIGFTGPQGVSGASGSDGLRGEKGEKGTLGSQGIKGDMGNSGLLGQKGQQGLRGVSATDSTLVSWNECSWFALNSGRDYGLIQSCRFNKMRNDTWLRITWGGNLRIAGCTNCCMRWFFTVNGQECSEPGPIDGLIFVGQQRVHLVRHTTITGSCRSTVDFRGNVTDIPPGPMRIQFSIMECPGFGSVYDAYTGFNSVSRIIIEEIIPRDVTYPEVAVVAPAEFVYTPSYCEFVFPHLGGNRERNVGVLVTRRFTKDHPHTVLRLTWEGNLRKRRCVNCCTRWWLEVDGSPCDSDASIETSIRSNSAQDVFAPTSISGFCASSGNLPISEGEHSIRLVNGNCPGSRIVDAGSGFFSTSRLIVEEIPRPRDPEVNTDVYHPQWQHCAIDADDITDRDLDIGPLPDISCVLNNKTEGSSVRVTVNGNLVLRDCQDCCMRWFVTLNGQECAGPAPIEVTVAASDISGLSLHRGSTISGICSETEDGPIPAGPVVAVLNVGQCEEFNKTFDAFTGFDGPTRITLEEYPEPIDSAPSDGFYPIWTQCVSDSPLNYTTPADNSTDEENIQMCSFNKQSDDTVLRVAWDGSLALDDCSECCMRWFVTVDGEECTDPASIDAAISHQITGSYSLHRPASIVGICRAAGASEMQIGQGEHSVELRVGACNVTHPLVTVPPRSGALTGFYSVSRFIVEEIPDSRSDCGSDDE